MHASPCSHWLLGAAVACLLLLGWPLVPTHAALSSLLLIVPTARPLPRPAVASGPPPSAMLGAGRAHPASPRQPQAQTPIRTLHYSAGAGSRAEPRSHRILSPAPDLGQALLGGCAVAIGALTACMAVRRRSQPPAVVGSARRLRPVTSGWGWSPAVWVGHPRLHVLTAPWALMAVGPAPSDAGEGAAGDPLQDARLLVLDTLVPGQRLEVEAHATLQELLAGLGETPLVVVGRERLTLNRRGVEVVAVTGPDPGADRLLLVTTGRVAEVCDGGGDEGSRWAGRAGSVRWLGTLAADDAVLSPDDAAAAAALPSDDQPSLEVLQELVTQWLELVRRTHREREPGQLDQLLADLGPAPAGPNAYAAWVAALINPLPALGVALEVRPAVLTARTTARRLRMAEFGLRDSIARLQRPGPCF